MRNLVGERLPNFSALESAMVKGSFDFVGLNYYTSRYAVDASNSPNSTTIVSYVMLDSQANLTGNISQICLFELNNIYTDLLLQ